MQFLMNAPPPLSKLEPFVFKAIKPVKSAIKKTF